MVRRKLLIHGQDRRPQNDHESLQQQNHEQVTSTQRIVSATNPNPVAIRNEKDKDDTLVICAELLIPGLGDPIDDACVVSQKGKIVYVGKAAELPSEFKAVSPVEVPVVMPGLWDCHCHLIGVKSFTSVEFLGTNPAVAGARLTRSVYDILMSGFTSVIDLGGFAPEMATVIEEGTIVGPTVYSAGAALSQTGGHGDVFSWPIGWVWKRSGVGVGANGDDVGGRPMCVVDGIDECRKAVRLQIRRGAKVIKVFASGGVLSQGDDPMNQQFSDEELKVIVEEATRQGRVVGAHVHGKPGIMAALRAGAKIIEHGTYLDEEAVEEMKKKDAILVATRTIVIEGVKHKELMDEVSYIKMLETAKHHKAAYSLAIKKGVKIALGTDLGLSTPSGTSLSLGMSGGEPLYAVEAGMTPLEAIEAATANGPATLGPQAPLSGQLKVGYDADIIALVRNPIDDITVLKNVDNVTHLWKGGKAFK